MYKRRVLVGAGFGILLFLVCTLTSLPASLLGFLVLGIVPGTDVVIPAWAILLVYPALIAVAVYWLHGEAFFIGEPTPAPKPIKSTAAKSKKARTSRAKKTTAAKRRARATA